MNMGVNLEYIYCIKTLMAIFNLLYKCIYTVLFKKIDSPALKLHFVY